jgi:hypothetical protein
MRIGVTVRVVFGPENYRRADEDATTMKPAAVVRPTTMVRPVTVVKIATAVNGATSCVRTIMHLRAGGTDASENRARRDACYCEFLHWLCHGRTFLTAET